MLQLIKRSPEYVNGYKAYCQEAFDNNVIYFVPTNPIKIDDDWFFRTKTLYENKEKRAGRRTTDKFPLLGCGRR